MNTFKEIWDKNKTQLITRPFIASIGYSQSALENTVGLKPIYNILGNYKPFGFEYNFKLPNFSATWIRNDMRGIYEPYFGSSSKRVAGGLLSAPLLPIAYLSGFVGKLLGAVVGLAISAITAPIAFGKSAFEYSTQEDYTKIFEDMKRVQERETLKAQVPPVNSSLAAVAEPVKVTEAEKWEQHYQGQVKGAIEATRNDFKRFSESQISLHELVLEACLGMVAVGRVNGEYFEGRKIYEAVYSEHDENKILNILEENEGSLISPENKAIVSELKAVVANEIAKKDEMPALELIEDEITEQEPTQSPARLAKPLKFGASKEQVLKVFELRLKELEAAGQVNDEYESVRLTKIALRKRGATPPGRVWLTYARELLAKANADTTFLDKAVKEKDIKFLDKAVKEEPTQSPARLGK